MTDNKLLGSGGLYYGSNEISKAYMGNNLVWEKANGITFLNIEFPKTAVVTNTDTTNTANILYDSDKTVNLSVSVDNTSNLSASISGNILTFNYLDAGGSNVTITDSISGLSVTKYIATISYTIANTGYAITPTITNGYNGSVYFNKTYFSYSTGGTSLTYNSSFDIVIKGVTKLKIKLLQSGYYSGTWDYHFGTVMISNYSVKAYKYFSSYPKTHYTYQELNDYKLRWAQSSIYNTRYGSWSDSNYYYTNLAWNTTKNYGPTSTNWGFQDWEYTIGTSQTPALITSGTTAQNTVEYTYTVDPTKQYTIGTWTQLKWNYGAAGLNHTAGAGIELCYVE